MSSRQEARRIGIEGESALALDSTLDIVDGQAKELIMYHMASYGVSLTEQFSMTKLEEVLRDMVGTGADVLMPMVKKSMENQSHSK